MSSLRASEASTAIRARDLSHTFADGTVALEHVDLEVSPGSFVALLGPSGCGKSTLLRLVSGLDRASHGELEVDGRSHLSFVFQDAHLLPWRTAQENVALPLELAGIPRSEAMRRALPPLEDVELSDARGRYPDELSGGMRMRVSIARALAIEPRVLLLDEPFAALDELTRQRLDERLRELWTKRRMTVLFVTHSLSEAVFLAERAVVMSKRPGKIVLDHAIELPFERSGALRTDVDFAKQTAILYRALEEHGSLDEPRP